MTAPANPDEGEVAIPWPSAPGGVIVGVLGARAIRWVEESLGEGLDHIWMRFNRSLEAGSAAGLRLAEASTIIWAAIEHQRRRTGQPATEYTIDDVDDLVDRVGRDDVYSYAYNLMLWSTSGRARREAIEAEAAAAGQADALGELKALASGIGLGTSAPPSPQA